MKKKYWFTLVEMFAVIIILGILAGVGIWRLSTRNADRYKAEMCVNQIYSKFSNFIHAAATNKIFKNTEMATRQWEEEKEIIAINYQIDFNFYEWGYFLFRINDWSEYIDVSQIRTQQYCGSEGEKYWVWNYKESSEIVQIHLQPWLQSKGNSPGIKIEKTIPTDSGYKTINPPIRERILNFYPDKTNSSNYEEFAKISLDARSGILRKSFCQLYNTDDPSTEPDESKTCKQRSL